MKGTGINTGDPSWSTGLCKPSIAQGSSTSESKKKTQAKKGVHSKLALAVLSNSLVKVKDLVEEHHLPNDPDSPLYLRNRAGESLVTIACYKNHPQVVRMLLRYKVDPNCGEAAEGKRPGSNALHWAVKKRAEDAVVDALLGAGCNPWAENRQGMTPFIAASKDPATLRALRLMETRCLLRGTWSLELKTRLGALIGGAASARSLHCVLAPSMVPGEPDAPLYLTCFESRLKNEVVIHIPLDGVEIYADPTVAGSFVLCFPKTRTCSGSHRLANPTALVLSAVRGEDRRSLTRLNKMLWKTEGHMLASMAQQLLLGPEQMEPDELERQLLCSTSPGSKLPQPPRTLPQEERPCEVPRPEDTGWVTVTGDYAVPPGGRTSGSAGPARRRVLGVERVAESAACSGSTSGRRLGASREEEHLRRKAERLRGEVERLGLEEERLRVVAELEALGREEERVRLEVEFEALGREEERLRRLDEELRMEEEKLRMEVGRQRVRLEVAEQRRRWWEEESMRQEQVRATNRQDFQQAGRGSLPEGMDLAEREQILYIQRCIEAEEEREQLAAVADNERAARLLQTQLDAQQGEPQPATSCHSSASPAEGLIDPAKDVKFQDASQTLFQQLPPSTHLMDEPVDPLTLLSLPAHVEAQDGWRARLAGHHEDELHVLCPITLEVMTDPVVLLGDSMTYERHSITEWLKRGSTSPLTGVALTEEQRVLVPNHHAKSCIRNHLARRESK